MNIRTKILKAKENTSSERRALAWVTYTYLVNNQAPGAGLWGTLFPDFSNHHVICLFVCPAPHLYSVELDEERWITQHHLSMLHGNAETDYMWMRQDNADMEGQ